MESVFCPEADVYTYEQIVDMVVSMENRTAISFWDTDREEACSRCVTCIITRYKDSNGVEHVFDYHQTDADSREALESKHYALYPRVSTEAKVGRPDRDDCGVGWRDQISLIVRAALDESVKTGVPIRIYNDGSFSGTYPPDDPQMIRSMYKTKANTYSTAFKEMVLNRCDADKKPGVQMWLDHHLAVIRNGTDGPMQGTWSEEDKRVVFPTPPDRSFADVEEKLKLRYRSHGGRRYFRPALHFMFEEIRQQHVALVFVYDLDRLSRDYALSEAMSKLFIDQDVRVRAITGNAVYFTSSDMDGQILRAVLMGTAAEFIKKNMRQNLRSQFSALSQGRPTGSIPQWLERDATGRIGWKRSHLPLVETALRCWMAGPDNYHGYPKMASEVNREVRRINGGAGGGDTVGPQRVINGVYAEATIRYWVNNPVVFGCIQQWGVSWPIMAVDGGDGYISPLLDPIDGEEVPPLALISRGQWERTIRERIRVHPSNGGRHTTNPRALQTLLKCRCGSVMGFKAMHLVNRPDHWQCYKDAASKQYDEEQTGLKFHICIRDNQIMNILTGIMRRDRSIFYPPEEAVVTLGERLARMTALRDGVLHKARQGARRAGLTEGTEPFKEVVETLKKAFDVEGYEASVTQLEGEMRDVESRPKPGSKEEEDAFDTLPPRRQNEILCSLLREVRVVSPHGPADLRGEYLEIVLKNGKPLPRINIILTKMLSTGRPMFRLPSYEQWLESWIGSAEEAIE